MTSTQTIRAERKQAKTRAPKRTRATAEPKQVKAKAKLKRVQVESEQTQQAESEPIVALTPKPANKGTFVLRITSTRPLFKDQLPEGSFLRRDQPRKPGDCAKFRGVERDRATLYRSRQQVSLKLAELASLYDGLQVEVIDAAPNLDARA